MKEAVAGLVLATLLAGSAFSQTSRPAADPLAVTPISPSQARAGDAAMIRTTIEQAGNPVVTDRSRDCVGVWRARARKGDNVVAIVVDKGGRIKPEPR